MNWQSLHDRFRKSHFWVWLPPALWYLGITYLSSLTPSQLGFSLPFEGADKIVHTFEFFCLGFLLMRAFFWEQIHHHFSRRSWILAFLLVPVLGILDEIHQLFVPLRQFDLFDWGADMTGGILGILLARYFYRKFRQKN